MACSKIDGFKCKEWGFKATSGAVTEDYSFEWKIANFLVIKSSKDFINNQGLDFDAGASHGTPTKWKYFLHEHTATKLIGIFLMLTKAPPKFKTIVNFNCQIVKPTGIIFKTGPVISREFSGKGENWGYTQFIPSDDENLKELMWEDGSIVIRLNLKLFIFKPVAAVQPNKVDVEEEVNRLENRELRKLSDSMRRMIELGSQPDYGRMTKVVSKDQVEFQANTATLSARSPVFQAMFVSGNWKEGQSSSRGTSLVLEDLSGKTVKVLLHFLMGGVLLKNEWNAGDVILGLTYAAQKYQLEGLTEFLDKVLPEITYGTEILGKLALLTKRLGMKNAERGLFSKLKEAAVDIDQLVLDKEGSLLGDN